MDTCPVGIPGGRGECQWRPSHRARRRTRPGRRTVHRRGGTRNGRPPGLLQIRASQAGFENPVPMPTPTVLTNNVVSAAGTGSTEGPQVILALDDGRVLHAVMNPNGEWTGFGDVKRQIGSIGTVTVVAAATPPDSPDAAHFVLATSDGQLWHTIRVSLAMDPCRKPHSPTRRSRASHSHGGYRGHDRVRIRPDQYSTIGTAVCGTQPEPSRATGRAGNVKDQIGDPGTVVSISAISREPGLSEWGLVTTDGKLLNPCLARIRLVCGPTRPLRVHQPGAAGDPNGSPRQAPPPPRRST